MDETVEDVVEEEEVADEEDVAVVEEDAVADAVEEDVVTDEDAEDEDAVPVSTPTAFLFQAPRGASWGLPPRFLLRRRCRPPRVLLPSCSGGGLWPLWFSRWVLSDCLCSLWPLACCFM